MLRFRGPRDPPRFVSRSLRSQKVGEPSGPGSLFNRRPNLPVCLHVDVNGTSQVPRRSILCLCPALRPRPNRRSLASLTVSSMLPPHFPRRRLQRLMNFGALSRGLGTCCLRFTNGVATIHAKLASGWLAHLYREGVEPSGSLQKVSDHPSSFSGLCLAQGKFHFQPPSRFTSLDHLVGGGEQRAGRAHCYVVGCGVDCHAMNFQPFGVFVQALRNTSFRLRGWPLISASIAASQ